MNGKTAIFRSLARGWLNGAVELLMFFPLWLTVAALWLQPQLQASWLLGLLLLCLCGLLMSLRLRTFWVRGVAAIVVAAIYMLPFGYSSWQAILVYAASVTAILRGAAMMDAEHPAAHVRRYIGGIASYFIGYIVFRFVPEWHAYLPWLTWAGIAALAIALFAVNRRVLLQETLSDNPRAAARAMQGYNRFMVVVVLIVSLIVTLAASGLLGRWLMGGIRAVLRWLLSGQSEQEPDHKPEAPQAAPPALPKGGESGWFQHFLDILFYVVGIAVACLLLFLLVRLVYRSRRSIAAFFKRIWLRLAAILGRKSEPAMNAGYVDEETDLFSWEAVERGIREKLRQSFGSKHRESWNELQDNREKVRYLYRQWLRKLLKNGYSRKPYLTPDETWHDVQEWQAAGGKRASSGSAGEITETAEVIGLYYKSRYGGKPVSDEEVGKLLAGAAGKRRSP